MLPSFSLALLLPCFFVCCIQFKQLRLLLLYGISSLAFCFPAFAEDEAYTFESDITEFTYLQNNEIKLDQIENHIIQDEIDTQNEIAAILAEPLANPSLRSISADTNSISFTTDRVSDTLFHYSTFYYGNRDISNFSYFVLESRNNNNWVSNLIPNEHTWQDIYSGYFDISLIPSSANNIRALYVFNQPNANPLYFGPSVNLSDLNNEPITVDVWSFSDIITQFLSWILASFSVLTSWILSDSMAAVYAAIFLVACCIAMLFRVLHSA